MTPTRQIHTDSDSDACLVIESGTPSGKELKCSPRLPESDDECLVVESTDQKPKRRRKLARGVQVAKNTVVALQQPTARPMLYDSQLMQDMEPTVDALSPNQPLIPEATPHAIQQPPAVVLQPIKLAVPQDLQPPQVMHQDPQREDNPTLHMTECPITGASAEPVPLAPEKTKGGYKYTVKFKHGSFERDFYMNDKDPVEVLYQELFGSDTERKLLYEDMRLSRFLLAGECGFFPGTNYIYLPEGEAIDAVKSVTVRFSENTAEDATVEISGETTAADIIKSIDRCATRKMAVILNGQVLDDNQILSDIVESGYVLDIVDFDLLH